ncbi:MAG: 5-formyltetrahydrofolate cyclo-ligase [Candidatus Competibacteraceae bacterium]|nr:5-formyltetrahydrofolate cyclo-ligase [Candidatus Competibacteraceae bacterium]
MTNPFPHKPNELRRLIRTRRRELSPHQRQQAARELARRVASLQLFQHARHIAAYLAFDGEMDPAPLVERAWSMGKEVYLPVLMGHPARMVFAPFEPGTTFETNRFGIPEPRLAEERHLPAQRLDLVLTPLVAFTFDGTRMGMGGGFYDRTFAFLTNPEHLHKPRLLGLAYELQQVEGLVRQPWDVPLDGIATEAGLYPGNDGKTLE